MFAIQCCQAQQSYEECSRTSTMLVIEFIHLRKAFTAERNATVSSASTFRIRQSPSFSSATFALPLTGLQISGNKASLTVFSDFSEGNLRRISAFAFITILHV